MSARAMAFAAAILLLAAAPPTPAPLTVQQILTRMAANTTGLKTYQVPVEIDARIHKIITLPVSMSGKRYFKAPDQEAMKMNTVPSIAKGFQNVYASLGTPATWPQRYDLTLVTQEVSSGRAVYEVRAVYKRSTRIDHIMLDVDATTFDPIQARWYYTNGATIVMNIEEQLVGGKYRLPTREQLDVTFPQYRGSAVVKYGDYVIDQAIPDKVFSGN
jgi:hypothetical protein